LHPPSYIIVISLEQKFVNELMMSELRWEKNEEDIKKEEINKREIDRKIMREKDGEKFYGTWSKSWWKVYTSKI